MPVISIKGSLSDENVYFCQHVANRIKTTSDDISIEFSVLPEIHFLSYLDLLRKQEGGVYHKHNALHIVHIDSRYVGDINALIQIAMKEFNITDASIASRAAFSRSVREETAKLLLKNRDYVYLEFGEEGNEKSNYGRILIEMYSDYCPIACDHFIALCKGAATIPYTDTKASYDKCPIHRLVKNGWFQCGDIIDGSGANSIVAQTKNNDKVIPDECFSADFGFELGGIVGLANTGTHTSGSQFFITLGPCDWMNNQFVGIGRLVYGFKTLQTINSSSVDSMQRPINSIIVKSCGIEYAR